MPGYQSDGVADLFFRFDFIVEADVGPARVILRDADRLTRSADAAIRRRSDMALPPFFQTIWLDQELAQVQEAATLQFLGLAHRPEAVGLGGRDFNLNPRRWQLLAGLEMPQLGHWAELCHEARGRAEETLRALPSIIGNLEAAIRRASVADYGRLAQLRARAQRVSVADEIEWKLEEALSASLMRGIRDPRVRVDAIVACFLSDNQDATAIVAGQA